MRFWTCGFIFSLTLLAGFSNVSKKVKEKDIKAILKLNADEKCLNLSTFNEEISCIQYIQEQQLKLVNSQECREFFISVEPLEYLNANKGCCWDRARFIEKALSYYNFKTKRISLYKPQSNDKFWLFKKSIPSHATSEVKTINGYLGIDSLSTLLLLDQNSQPLTFRKAKEIDYKFGDDQEFFALKEEYKVIEGLYSRIGNKYGLKFIPDINVFDFFNQFL